MGLADIVAVQAYHGRGEAYFANAQPDEAITCFDRSLELARRIGDKSYESENLMMIGHACVGSKGLGDYPRAANMERGLSLARDTGIHYWRPVLEAHLAVARMRLGDRDCVPALEAVLDRTREASERYLMIRCLFCIIATPLKFAG